MKCFVLFILYATFLANILACTKPFTNTIADQCIGLVCIPENYSSTVLPFQNQTNNITVDFELIRILKVDDHEYTITLLVQSIMQWIEPRLKPVSKDKRIVINNVSVIDLPKDLLWMPDTYIYDLHSTKTRVEKLALINENLIHYSAEMEIVIYCPMNFDNYPLDSHICHFKMGSYGYNVDQVNFISRGITYAPISGFFKQLTVLDYNIQLSQLPESQSGFVFETEFGPFSRSLAGFEIKLQRKTQKYIYYYYVPSGLLALISCVSTLIGALKYDIHVIRLCTALKVGLQKLIFTHIFMQNFQCRKYLLCF